VKIYTKSGDDGETSLFGGMRVPKDDLRIRAYGTVDELNSVLGLVLAEGGGSASPEFRKRILRVQHELFQLGGELAIPRGKTPGFAIINEPDVERLEHEIDSMEEVLPTLKSFILPGGSRDSAILHLARTVSRRAERELVSLHRGEPQRPVVLRYLNRLSDYLFVCARFANKSSSRTDEEWHAKPIPKQTPT
jgi:cob(I)alamin adenosyltransferase